MGLFDLFKKKPKVSPFEKAMSRDLREIEEAMLDALNDPSWSIAKTMRDNEKNQEDYIIKLFFSTPEEGGFGFPIEKLEEILSSELKKQICFTLNFLTAYKEHGRILNYWIEFARIFFTKGLKEPPYIMYAAVGNIALFWEETHKRYQEDPRFLRRFEKEVFYNPESFLYDQRLYEGDKDLIKYKINFCFNVFALDNFLHLRENMTIEEVLTAPSIEYLKDREDEIDDMQ